MPRSCSLNRGGRAGEWVALKAGGPGRRLALPRHAFLSPRARRALSSPLPFLREERKETEQAALLLEATWQTAPKNSPQEPLSRAPSESSSPPPPKAPAPSWQATASWLLELATRALRSSQARVKAGRSCGLECPRPGVRHGRGRRRAAESPARDTRPLGKGDEK